MTTRAVDMKYLKTIFPPEPLVQIKNNFTEMSLIMPTGRIARTNGPQNALFNNYTNGFVWANKRAARPVDKKNL